MENLAAAVQEITNKALGQPPVTSTPPRMPVSPPSWPIRSLPDVCLNLDPSLVPEAFKGEIRRAHQVSQWPIYLFGDAGRGKSYAMAWAYSAWKGRSAFWTDVSYILRQMMRCRMAPDGYVYENHSQVFESTLTNRVDEAELVCFDDLGLRGASDAMYDALYQLVNSRKGKPTIYTGNLAPDKLRSVYDSRIASRVLEGTWIEMTGEDQRMAAPRYVKI